MLLIISLLMAGCKSKKRMTEDSPAVHLSSAELRMQSLLQNNFQFDELSISGSITARMNGESFSSAVSIRMQKDQQIWVSIKPMLGIEAIRALIRPDSIFVVDRLNKQYLEKPFSWLIELSKAPLNFAILQDVLLNNADFVRAYRPVLAADGMLYLEGPELKYQLSTTPDNKHIASTRVQRDSQQLIVNYTKYLDFEQQQLPQQIQILIQGSQSGAFDINFSKFVKENGQRYPFSIPNSYSKMD